MTRVSVSHLSRLQAEPRGPTGLWLRRRASKMRRPPVVPPKGFKPPTRASKRHLWRTPKERQPLAQTLQPLPSASLWRKPCLALCSHAAGETRSASASRFCTCASRPPLELFSSCGILLGPRLSDRAHLALHHICSVLRMATRVAAPSVRQSPLLDRALEETDREVVCFFRFAAKSTALARQSCRCCFGLLSLPVSPSRAFPARPNAHLALLFLDPSVSPRGLRTGSFPRLATSSPFSSAASGPHS